MIKTYYQLPSPTFILIHKKSGKKYVYYREHTVFLSFEGDEYLTACSEKEAKEQTTRHWSTSKMQSVFKL